VATIIPKEEYIKQKEQEKKEVLLRLQQGVKDVFESEKYREFLKAYSKFNDYSINNTILILMQKPEAERVGSFQTWKRLGRNVNKGEKGIKVLVPIPYKYQKRVERIDTNGVKDTEDVELNGLSFRLGNIFDISQTQGKELPTLTTELTENSPDIKRAIHAVELNSPVPIHYDKPVGKANGYYHLEDKYIAVRLGMSDSQTFKTLIHEVSHSMLHSIDEIKYDRKVQEVQAESVAFLVCSKYKIDTSTYSFGYISGYSSNKDTRELKSSLDTITKCADEITNSIDKVLGTKSLEDISNKKTKEMTR